MRMGQGVRTGLGHGGITCVLQTQFSSFFFFFNYSVFKESNCTITNKANSSLLNNLNVTIISIKTI